MMRILAVASAYSLAAASLVWSAAALALGLGDVDVRSRLNERFAASIPLDSASPEDLESLTVTIASADEFARRGLERNDQINALRFELNGNAIKVASAQPVRDPFLNFIIEARWNAGRLLREYTVLLDPPASAPPSVGAMQAPEATTAPAPKPEPTPVTEAVADVPARYGPVKPAQTLWSIATLFRRDPAVTMDQMLLAIYNMNPTAFGGGSINHLLSGQTLIVPTAEDALAIDADAARDRVARLRAANGAAPVVARKPAAVQPAAPVPLPAPAPEPTPAPVPAPAPAPAAAEAAPAAVIPPPASSAPVPDVQTPETTTEVPASESNGVESAAPSGNPADSAAAEVAPEPVASSVPDAQVAEVPAAAAPAEALAADVAAITDQDAVPWLPIAALALLVLALVGFKLWQRRSSATRRKGSPKAATRDMFDEGPDLLMEQPWARSTVAQALAESGTSPPAAAVEPTFEPTAEPIAERDETALAAAPAIADVASDEPLGELDKPEVGNALEASDPLTEADFHLAYGLYDEAAQMLQNAIAAAPERGDLKMKLAETYSAAGNAAAFQTLAEGMIDTASPADWQKISVMGRALLPESLLFGGLPADFEGSADAATAPRDLSVIDFDLDTDPLRGEPLPTEVPLAVSPPSADEIAPVSIPDPVTESLLRPFDEPILEFDLPPATPPVPAAAVFEPVAMPVPEQAPVSTAQSNDAVIDIDLSSFDLDDEGNSARSESGQVTTREPFLEIPLDESAFEVVPEPESEVIGGDEIDTKLDLARAYADMGDLDAARTLIAEVENAGNDKQQQEARALSQRLLG